MKINFKNKLGNSVLEINTNGTNIEAENIIVKDKSLKELAEKEENVKYKLEENSNEEEKEN